MSPQTHEALSELIAKGYDLTLEDMTEIEFLQMQLPWEDACRSIDAINLIITDPIYQGDIPADYFDQGD